MFVEQELQAPAAEGTAGAEQSSGRRRPQLTLLRVAKAAGEGSAEVLAAVLQVQLQLRKSGCLHIVLQSLGGEPQHLLQNATRHPLRYRQATQRGRPAWALVQPFSAAGVVRSRARPAPHHLPAAAPVTAPCALPCRALPCPRAAHALQAPPAAPCRPS
jgi:hypothetical protein